MTASTWERRESSSETSGCSWDWSASMMDSLENNSGLWGNSLDWLVNNSEMSGCSWDLLVSSSGRLASSLDSWENSLDLLVNNWGWSESS